MTYLDELQYFTGKVCTVLTHATTLQLRDVKQHSQYFTGEITKINAAGVWVEHMQAKTLAHFPFPLLGIVEEQYIDPDSPMAAKLKAEMEKKEEESRPRPPGTFIPIEELSKVSREVS